MAEFPVTLDNLILRVRRLLEDSPRQDILGANIADTTTTSVTVTTLSNFEVDTKFEIDDEIFLTTSVAANPLTALRGYEGTTAATHTSGAIVRLDPRFPTATLKEAINVTLNNWISPYMPRLQWDSSTAGNFVSNRWIYQAPASATKVRKVAYQPSGANGLNYIDAGPLRPFPTNIVASGLGVEVYDVGLFGHPVLLYYESAWPALETGASTVPIDFPPTADELIVTGAALYLLGWRMVPKIRLDEIVFHRESNAPMPPNLSLGAVDKFQKDWLQQMQRIANSRPGGEATKVWR